MSKLKRHKHMHTLADKVLDKMNTRRLLAHYRKCKIVSEFVPNWDEPAPSPLISEAHALYLVKLIILLSKREHLSTKTSL